MKVSRSLLIRFSRGECTKDEERLIQQWLHDGSWPSLPEEDRVPDDIREKVWNRLSVSIQTQAANDINRSKGRFRVFLAAAAVLLLLIGSAVYIYYNNGAGNDSEVLSYVSGENEYKRVMLPDSSVVFLSPESSIETVAPYTKDRRVLRLTGEAVFEVVSNASAPFRVTSGDITAIALGTSFKMTSFPEENKIQVALSYGKVVVKDHLQQGREKSLYLDPGEEVVYDKVTQSMQKNQPTPRLFDYRRDILYFKNADFDEVVEKLEGYYQVKVRYDNLKDARWRVSGEFDYQPLDVVMRALAYSCNIDYEIKGDNLILKNGSVPKVGEGGQIF